jgi:hypothetical protein
LISSSESDISVSTLQEQGFSESIIERFFRPFLSGTFFNPDLTVTSRTFELIMRAFAVGPNCIPANGMQAIADQLAAPLEATGSIFLNTPVATVKRAQDGNPAAVVLGNGKTVTARKCGPCVPLLVLLLLRDVAVCLRELLYLKPLLCMYACMHIITSVSV